MHPLPSRLALPICDALVFEVVSVVSKVDFHAWSWNTTLPLRNLSHLLLAEGFVSERALPGRRLTLIPICAQMSVTVSIVHSERRIDLSSQRDGIMLA